MKQYSEKDDGTLVELSLLGQEQAFEELVMRHEKSVLGTAYKVTSNRFSAEDAAQDAFVSAWMNLSSLRTPDSFGAWVCAIAKNHALSLVRRYAATVPSISLDTVLLSESDEDARFYLAEEDYSDVHRAVEALSDKLRETVKMHYFEDLSVSEIAERLSVPVGTVKWHLCEARKQLRKGYGIMEAKYEENEDLLARVMRQVEALKLWRLRGDKTGFEADYRNVMEAVNSLPETKEKQYAFANVLLLGYWWLPGQENDETLARIRAAAEAGHNDEVMMSVMSGEHNKLSGQRKIDFIKEKQIPWLEQNGYTQSLGYVWFWMAREYLTLGKIDEAVKGFRRVTDILDESAIYHANALAALVAIECEQTAGDCFRKDIAATGEELHMIDGKWYYWAQPGFSGNSIQLLWNMQWCDSLLLDPTMKPGDSVTSSDGKSVLTCVTDGVTVTTPAGVFEHCVRYRCTIQEGDLMSETYLCPGVGIVRQKYEQLGDTMTDVVLTDYVICGGSGLLPFAKGNTWTYSDMETANSDRIEELNSVFTVVHARADRAILSHTGFWKVSGYKDTWRGQILRARETYCKDEGTEHLVPGIMPCFDRAAELAETKREKVHTAIAKNVMQRIMDTDPDVNPDYAEKGAWNFFSIYDVNRKGEQTSFKNNGGIWSFEWKAWLGGVANYRLFYNFLYDILSENAGCVYSEQWAPGWHEERSFKLYHSSCTTMLDVYGGETVIVPAGQFDGCLRVHFTTSGKPNWVDYRNGTFDYWFAPGVGIVQMSRPITYERVGSESYKQVFENIWWLTEYKGTGEGFFPFDDGLFRRYEPKDIGEGCHGFVEYTFDRDETGTVCFRNACGTKDRNAL